MLNKKLSLVILIIFSISVPFTLAQSCNFKRGDFNNDEVIDVSDSVATLGYLFQGQRAPSCMDAIDADDNGIIDVTDPIFILQFLFLGGPELPFPFSEKGIDPTKDDLTCGQTDAVCHKGTQCGQGEITEACLCGSSYVEKETSSKYCCLGGKYQDKPCTYLAYTNLVEKEKGLEKKAVFLCPFNDPESCDSAKPEYQVTYPEKEDSSPDIAHISYSAYQNSPPVQREVIVWQRYEEGRSSIYICLLTGKRPGECESSKIKISTEEDSFNPSIEYAPKSQDIQNTIITWETESSIKACSLIITSLGIRCNSIELIKKSGLAYPVLAGRILLWKEKINDENYILKGCSLTGSDPLNAIQCSPIQIALGKISPETGDAWGSVVYTQKTDTGHAIFLNGRPIHFNNPLLKEITLSNSPQIFVKWLAGKAITYIVFKDINMLSGEENTIWIVGIEENAEGGIVKELYRVLSPYHLSIHGPSLFCDDKRISCLILDKNLGPKLEGPFGDTGKLTQWNNFQNQLFVCSLNALGNIQKGESNECLERLI